MEPATRLLLIEDDQIDRLACRRAFAEQAGIFEFLETDTGAEGLSLARAEQPNCILLDYRLPDMNGLDFLLELNGNVDSQLVSPPVVMFTGANDVAVAVEAMRRGARDFLLKDAEHRHLQLLPTVVERVLQERRLTLEKQRAELALARAHRLITAGELAAALAHELNQPLAAIATFSEACTQHLNHETLDRQKLQYNNEQIALQAQRAGQTIRELHAFLTKGDTQKSAVDLNQLIRSTCKLVAAEGRTRGIAITLDLVDPLPPVRAARVHLEHVLVNLAQNAIEALRSSGTANQSIVASTRSVGGVAQVSVRDTGPGLDPETVHHMFEPFYTTKAEGLGMGLAISRSIIEAHEGKIWAESPAGGGAVFHFTLPFAG